MERRRFLTSSFAASALAADASAKYLEASQQGAEGKGREYYLLRRYQLRSGPQRKLADDYFREALIPALNRLGVNPVGVFSTSIGPKSPSLYVLLPSTSVEILVTVDFRLDQDAEYLKAGAAFLTAPAREPAYTRMESSLMLAFEGRPRLTVPPATAEHGARMFELRTYESPSDHDHRRKVEMFHSGEFAIFEKAGFRPVFYGDTLVGARMPNLTYMLSFDNLEDRDKKWDAFREAPEWKKLSSSPRYNFEPIVSNITNLILSPMAYSQI